MNRPRNATQPTQPASRTNPKPEPQPPTWTLRLPWTAPPLTLNSRQHWHAKHRITREIRTVSAALARANRIPKCARIHVKLTYFPRQERTRDADNLVATLKPLIDGLRDALVIDDDNPAYIDWDPPHIAPADPGDPRLLLTITRLEDYP